MKIECPHCGSDIHVSEDIDSYDWDSGCYIGGLAEVDCMECEAVVRIGAHGMILDVEVLDD